MKTANNYFDVFWAIQDIKRRLPIETTEKHQSSKILDT